MCGIKHRLWVAREIATVCGLLAIAVSLPRVEAQDFSVVVALGDSLTDTPAQRGPNHAEHIADRLGMELINLALAGSRSHCASKTKAIQAGASTQTIESMRRKPYHPSTLAWRRTD